MSEILVKSYAHRTGFHCGSSSVRNLMRFFGHELSEPMCLGLGMAPNFFFYKSPEISPTRMFMGRNPTLEEDFFRILEIAAPVRRHHDAKSAWEAVQAAVDAGVPVMMQVDIAHLPYYNTKAHFGGHKVILAGYDLERGVAFISDSEFPEVQSVPFSALSKARSEPHPPWNLQSQWWDLRGIENVEPLSRAVPRAITGAAERCVRDATKLFGVGSMRCLAEDLATWDDAPDWSWCARFGYQVIERRGTGGGSFREKYADFLFEAAPYDPRIEALKLEPKMRSISAMWSDFAMLLKAISERPQPSGFGEASRLFFEIAEEESAFFEAVLAGG